MTHLRLGALRPTRNSSRKFCKAFAVVVFLALAIVWWRWWEHHVAAFKRRVSVNSDIRPASPQRCPVATESLAAYDEDDGDGIASANPNVPPASGTHQCRWVSSLRLLQTFFSGASNGSLPNVGGEAEPKVVDTLLHLRNPFYRPDTKEASRATKIIMLHSWEGFFRCAANTATTPPPPLGAKRFAWLPELLPSFLRGDWLFATNNNGHRFSNKQVSRDGIAERRAYAERAVRKASNVFAYTKWELPRDHSVHLAARADVDSNEFRSVVAALTMDPRVIGWQRLAARALQRVNAGVSEAYLLSLARRAVRSGENSDAAATTLDQLVLRARKEFVDHATLGDFFVSLYHDGDFLTSHTDDSLGSVAVVGHFSVRRGGARGGGGVAAATEVPTSERGDDGVSAGGETSFYCADAKEYCFTMGVSQDSLVVFPTRPYLVPHKVHRNKDPNLFRFGFTGWFALGGERQVVAY